MAEYLIQDSTLTGIADGVRTITGTTEQMSPSAMKSDLETFDKDMTEIAVEQDNLIAQIIATLEDKISEEDSGGGSGLKKVNVTSVTANSQLTLTVMLEESISTDKLEEFFLWTRPNNSSNITIGIFTYSEGMYSPSYPDRGAFMVLPNGASAVIGGMVKYAFMGNICTLTFFSSQSWINYVSSTTFEGYVLIQE